MPSVSNGRPVESDDDIVLSGISGRFPESNSLEEFAQNLFDGVDLVTADDRRWTPGLHGLPERNGKLKDLKSFDASFFGVHMKQANLMDPQLRMLLEVASEAMVDAGYSPTELRGSRTGVYVGVSSSEAEEKWLGDPDKINGYALVGCCRAMFANRLSYTFDFKGPSFAVDTACSSSLVALATAAAAMRAGQCDAAVIGGCNLVLKPNMSLSFHRLSMLSPDGRCAAFDASGRGYVRSEAVVTVLLQRRRDARRVYATLRNARINTDGAKEQGITFPIGAMQRELAADTFREAGLQPKDVVYVEAHGTGTKVGDPQEVNAIAELFCPAERREPLLLGSVKSNMGHSEPASGLCSLAKVLVGAEHGLMPQNLHYVTPNPDIPALTDGRLKVVDRNTEFPGGLIAVNSFGFGGANAHLILETKKSQRGLAKAEYEMPRLVVASGRTREAVESLLAHAAAHAADAPLHALLDAVAARAVPGHAWRGYRLLGAPGDEPVQEIAEIEAGEVGRPVWLVFSGMGSQWAGMGRELMALPPFAASIRRSADALRPLGLDLVHVLTEADESAFEDVVNSFVSIIAVQVALVDWLRAAGLPIDGVVGHSVGENGCAYADDTLSAAQAVLAAYWRGRSVRDAALPPGAMAAVGLSWDEAARRCPPDVAPACHNSEDSVTVSGPPESIEKLVAELSAEGIFARRVKSSGVAFHSRYIAPAAPLLRRSLEQVIPEPRARSPRWVSSSVPRDRWDSDIAKLSDASYHVNNLLSPVRFADALRSVPAHALVVEVAPHALLQAVLKRALPDAAHVPLVRRDAPAAGLQPLQALGRMYLRGAQPQPGRLYPPVPFPVPQGTPGLASWVKWDHSAELDVPDFGQVGSGENVIEVDLASPEWEYIAGHNIDGRVLFPATGYLYLVWKTVAKLHNTKLEETPIVLENVSFRRATIVSREQPVRFLVSVLAASGDFEVCEGGASVVSGRVRLTAEPAAERLALPEPAPRARSDAALLPLDADDVYKELRLRGYHYAGAFRGIRAADARGAAGTLAWEGNWVSFIDTMLQFAIVGVDSRQLQLPTRLLRAALDPQALLAAAAGGTLPVRSLRHVDVIAAPGVELRGVKTSLAPRRANVQAAPRLETYEFVPLRHARSGDPARTRREALRVALGLLAENAHSLKLKAVEAALERAPEALLLPLAQEILEGEPQLRVSASLAAGAGAAAYRALCEPLDIAVTGKDALQAAPDAGAHLVLAADVLARHGASALRNLAAALEPATGMLLLEEPSRALDEPAARDLLARAGLAVVAVQGAANADFILLRPKPVLPPAHVAVEVRNESFAWVEPLRDALKRAETEDIRVYVWSTASDSGVLGLATCLRQEPGGRRLRALLAPGAPAFSVAAPEYAEAVALDLAAAVRRGAAWGSMRHLALADAAEATLPVELAYVNTLTRGDLSSLRWVEAPAGLDAGPGAVRCRVHYAPLNFRDIMLATGKLPPDALPGDLASQECILGLEFSGREESSGRRVMGMVAARGLASAVAADAGFLWDVPAAWSLRDAATVPVAYATAYYALVVRGRMRRGETLLVHAGSGGVGQAAISIALSYGCTVYTTVGTADKRAWLRTRFPSLPDAHIGNSRDASFEQLVRSATGGRGVDLVLNSLAGEQLLASVRCLAVGGRFLEIGKLDLSNDTALGMSVFLKNTTFHGILLDALFEGAGDAGERAAVVRCVKEGIASGAVKPLPASVYSEGQLEQAFRFMATGRHIGKVLLQVREDEADGHKLFPALPRVYMRPESSYVLVGGTGGFGLELAGWLVSRGARTLVLNSRSGVVTGYQSWCIRRWREQGVRVVVTKTDATTEEGARALLGEAAALAPVAGIFHLAAVLRDGFLEGLSAEDFKTVAKPKIDGTVALDKASRALTPSLEHFVLFSSVSCGRGNAGQSNYGLANSAMERIAELRQRDGLPALAIQWGAIGEVGLVANMTGGAETEVGGTVPQLMSSCLSSLGTLLARPHAVAGSLVLADKRRAAAAPTQQLTQAVANILGIKDAAQVPESSNLAELGMDSLMGAEIKQTLERSYDVVLSVADIRALTFAKLKAMAAGDAPAPTAAPALQPGEEPAESEEELVRFMVDGPLMPEQTLVTLRSQPAPGADPVFMVHPIEGVADSLKPLAARVRGPVLCLQCTSAAPLSDLPALAAHYLRSVLAVQPQPPYTLLGYSFGAAVAIELALQLQKLELETQLVLVDGSHEFVSAHTSRDTERRDKHSAAHDETDALVYFSLLFRQANVAQLTAELEAQPDWDSRVALAVERLGDVGRQPAELKAAAASFYGKLRAAHEYRPAGPLRARTTLFKAENFLKVDESYGLQALVAPGLLTVTPLRASHRSILGGAHADAIAAHVSSLLQ